MAIDVKKSVFFFFLFTELGKSPSATVEALKLVVCFAKPNMQSSRHREAHTKSSVRL